MSEKPDLPQWLLEERHDRAASLPGKIARFLWVTITMRHSDKTPDEKAAMWEFITTQDRQKWTQWAEVLIDAVDAARRAEGPPGAEALVQETRTMTEKWLRLVKRDLWASGPGEDVDQRRRDAKAAMPKVIQAIKDLAKTEMELHANHVSEWSSLSYEDQADSFLAGMEAWPEAARDHMARRLQDAFPVACAKAQKKLLNG